MRRVSPDLREDARQEVFLGVFAALPRYDPSRGGLTTFLQRRAAGALQDFWRRRDPVTRFQRGKIKRGETTFEPPAFVPFDNLTDHDLPADRGASALDELLYAESCAQLHAGLGQLNPRALLVLMAFYRDGRTLADIAEELGVRHPRVWQIRKAAIERLRRLLTRANPQGMKNRPRFAFRAHVKSARPGKADTSSRRQIGDWRNRAIRSPGVPQR